MRLQTCKRGMHVYRMELRAFWDERGKHIQEWHVCRFCKHERKHKTQKVVNEYEALRGRK